MKRLKMPIPKAKLDTLGKPLPGDERRATGKGSRGTGTRRGQQYRATAALKDAIIYAAQAVGEDGKGLDGLVGYLKRLARDEPRTFGPLLGRVLPLHVTSTNTTEVTYRSSDEVRLELEKRGIIVDRVYN